jgi:hypothetical protein
VSNFLPGQLPVVNVLLAQLGYPVVGDEWSQSVRLPNVMPDRATRVDSPGAGHHAEASFAQIDQLMQERIKPLLKLWAERSSRDNLGFDTQLAGIVAYSGATGQESRYWELNLTDGELRTGEYAEPEDLRARWLLTAHVGTWAATLSGERNLSECLRSRDVRYVSFSVSDEEDRTGLTTELRHARVTLITQVLAGRNRP